MSARLLAVLLCIATGTPLALPQSVSNKPSATRVVSPDPQASAKAREREIQPGHLRKILELPVEHDPISSLAASRDGNLIVYTIDRFKRRSVLSRLTTLLSFDLDKLDRSESTLKIWDRATGQLKTTVKDETVFGFVGFYLTPDGKTIATHDAASTPAVKLWNSETGELLSNLAGPAKGMVMSALSPNGRFLAAAYEDSTARLWTIPGGELRGTLGSPPKKQGSWFKRLANNQLDDDPYYWVGLYFSPDSKLIATAGADKDTGIRYTPTRSTKVWDTATGQLRFVIPGSDAFFWRWEGPDLFSPDGSMIATTYTERDGAGHLTANSVKLWSSKDGSLLKTLEHARAPVKFSPDGKRLATGLVHWDDDGTWDFVGEIWNVETGELERKLQDPKGSLDEILWSPDGRTLATTGGGKYTLTLWDSQSGQQKAQIRLVRRHCFDPISECISDLDLVFFSSDGRFLIAANEKSLRIIEVKTGTVLEKVEGIGLPAIFLSNGQLLTRSANKKSVVVWETLGN